MNRPFGRVAYTTDNYYTQKKIKIKTKQRRLRTSAGILKKTALNQYPVSRA